MKKVKKSRKNTTDIQHFKKFKKSEIEGKNQKIQNVEKLYHKKTEYREIV